MKTLIQSALFPCLPLFCSFLLAGCSSSSTKPALSQFAKSYKYSEEVPRRVASTGAAQAPTNAIPLSSQPLLNAEQVLARLINLEAKLYSTCGFKTSDELIGAAKTSGGTLAQAATLLMNEQLEVALAGSSDRRDGFVKSGFLNFRQASTKTDHGGGAVIGREIVEGNYIGLTAAAYTSMDASIKPKSGYISPLPGSGLIPPATISSYGDDHYIFKLSRIRNRISVTGGDSLNRRVSMEDDSGDWSPLLFWDQVYTPWTNRELLIPLLAGALKTKKMGVELPTFTESYNQLIQDFPGRQSSNFMVVSGPADANPDQPTVWASAQNGTFKGSGAFSDYAASWGLAMDYIEVQIWGLLTMEDVAAFEFTKIPPDGAFLAELQKRGIQIRDARK